MNLSPPPSTPAPATLDTGNRLAVTDELREACAHLDFGDFGIGILIASLEEDRKAGMTESEQLDLWIAQCREDGGASLDPDCLACIGAVVDQIYGQ